MARSSVTQPTSDGGLGVVDVQRKLMSLRAVWFRRFFSESPHPWTTCFRRHVFTHFGACVEDLLQQDSIAAYRVRRLPPFYASLLNTWITLKPTRTEHQWAIPNPIGEDVVMSKVTAKQSYKILAILQHVEHKSVSKFRDWNIAVQWKDTWASLRLWRFVRSVQDTSWLSFHGILPTADRLIRFQMQVNPSCFCGEPESLLHLFVSCPLAKELLDWFLLSFCRFDPRSVTLTSSEILFGFTSRSRHNVPVVFTALMGVLRHHIWLARNKHRFENLVPCGQDTLRNAKSSFRFLVRMHKRHCRRDHFIKEWLANGIVGSITREEWIRFSRDFVN